MQSARKKPRDGHPRGFRRHCPHANDMDLNVEDLCGLLKRSRLVTREQVHAIHDRWVVEANEYAGSASHFTRWLVKTEVLTDYQASLLAKGQVDDFFLGDYKILERIGKGRMAGVYKAQHKDGKLVAVKVLPPSRTKIPMLMARFQREALLTNELNHPHVVKALAFGEANGNHYIVMELLDGEPLDEILVRRGKLPIGEAVRIVRQALLGLQHMHEHGVIHRDLKPSNLMLCPKVAPGSTTIGQTVKILDIGLARRNEESASGEKTDPTDVTQEGVLLGTPDYLSPEQARDPRSVDIRSDIYSLGCVLFHLLTGQTPFPESNLLNLMLRHATEPPRPLRDFIPDCPEPLQMVLSGMMAKTPEYRYPTPIQVADALEAFLIGHEQGSANAADRIGDTTLDAAPRNGQTATKRRKRVPTARPLHPFGKNRGLAASAPMSAPHRAPRPAPLPDEIELVPLQPPSPFATDADQAHDDEEPLMSLPRRRRPQKASWGPAVAVACILMAAFAFAAVIYLVGRT